jgi:anhydro-N-acetylmuramic acid kinase
MATWVQDLAKIAKKEKRLVAGVISGTSVDAIKVAICSIESGGIPLLHKKPAKVKLEYFGSYPYQKETQTQLQRSLALTTKDIAELHVTVAEEFASAIHAACRQFGIETKSLDLIGSHGQTIYHHSSRIGAKKVTFQIGDGDVIAERCGVSVIFDFRARDIAAGGEGAPLTPYADSVLFGDNSLKETVILNLGGIGNITFIVPEQKKVVGFDTGPANGILDRLARIISKGSKRHDTDGALALSGTVNFDLLERLIAEDAYLTIDPPKSTGFETYGDDFVSQAVDLHGAADGNLMATLVAFIAKTVAISIEKHGPKEFKRLIVVGGGGQNPAILQALKSCMPEVSVALSDDLGVPSAAREAMAFALFANDTLLGIPASLPSITGAAGPRVLGKIALA